VIASSLSDQDITALAATYDIISLGMMADEARQRHHGLSTTFVRVVDVPLEGDVPVVPATAGEIRIVGTPPTRQAALDRVRAVAAEARGVPVSGFSLADLEHLAAVGGETLRALLEELCATGLELVADAPFDRLRDARRCVEEVNISGLALARLTIHQLLSSDAVVLFKQVAELQRRVGVIRSFAPLPRSLSPAVPTTGYDDVKRVALARLIVDNIPSIQVDWSLYGPKLAQVVLTVGADDIDGVSADEGPPEGRRRAPLEEIRRNIRAAGQVPRERNGRREILVDQLGDQVAGRDPARAGQDVPEA
jgi:hypothetical protein